ncbi:HYC_CC_PP family protein [Flagellimonas sp.]|uniref:HYC_CC_PP family protein n=1 Tax=Flagellimonas sp. TaxID=2058762 RepID=UPI003B50553F
MKAILNQILSSILALLVLLSTVSWTVDKHICMGKVVDVAFFANAKTCGMEVDSMGMDSAFEKSCCDDESFTLQGQEDLKTSFFDLDLKQQLFLASYTYSYINLFQDVATSTTSLLGHPPPLLDKDYQVLYETFLI